MSADRSSSFWRKFSPLSDKSGGPGDAGDSGVDARDGDTAPRQPYRWVRRNDSTIVSIETAVGNEIEVGMAVADQKRLASEMRARELEGVIAALEKQLGGLQETVEIVSRRARYYETSFKTLAKKKPTGSGSGTPNAKERPDPVEERLYSQVGLHPGCPDFMVEAARKVFLTRHHPDKVAPAERERATVEFQFYEKLFRTLLEQRRVRSDRH